MLLDMKDITNSILSVSAIVFLVYTTSYHLHGQSYSNQSLNKRSVDRNEWEELKKDIDYSSSKLKEQESSNKKDKLSNGTKKDNNNSFWMQGAMFQDSTIIKYLFFFLSILALIIVIIKMINSQFHNQKVPLTSKIREIEQAVDKVEESDLDYLLSEAKKRNNLKLSVRIYYLTVLKVLSDKSLIKWKKDKTNRMYEEEIINTDFYKDFQLLTKNFEKSWFSEANLTIEDFQIIESRFQQFITRLKL